ncbi:MAG: type I restriction-modification system subunit M [Proteobacteria bacterium]|nr:type I restriction-modification system subunit M [Pseudomonadota bacterium]MBU2227328.1 type I restriction-modification system subunit M [Pseudomonadota bacterium]MBU2261299.1 type I restriction-modification system subunit M [Pseudomonadota bacterium]
MTNNHSNQLVQKLWNYCNVLRDDGLSYGDYVEQLTFLLFLKMADEQSRPPHNKPSAVPQGWDWPSLLARDGDDLEIHYRHTLEELGKRPGMLGVIFRKAQNKIQDPAKLRRLIVDLIDKEEWTSLSADVKGDAYEGLLQKNAEDVKGGAGQYFTPRALIAAMVDAMAPRPGQTICDPACGTGGFLLAAHDYIARTAGLDKEQKKRLKFGTLFGVELVDGVTRLCAMNLLLHGIGGESDAELPVVTKDALAGKHGEYDMVLANPPFGKKSSVTIVNGSGEQQKESLVINRDDFWATTSNKQLNFLQHIFTILRQRGRAAVVMPDNVLFEGGAGETVRRELLKQADVHTLLRLPTGIFYAQGVKANVLFFDRKPARETPWTEKIWIYDLRTNLHFTLKENPLKRADLDDFVACYHPENRHLRTESERFKTFGYADLLKRDKVNLDIFWLKDESLEDSANIPAPEVIAREIADDLEAALEQFATIAEDLRR